MAPPGNDGDAPPPMAMGSPRRGIPVSRRAVLGGVAGGADAPIHPDPLERSAVLGAVERRCGTMLLPEPFPEGNPIHPAYPSGHATWAGAFATALKAFFDEGAAIATPVVVAEDGLSTAPYAGSDAAGQTLGGELNKLAWNLAVGRRFAGVP